MPIKIATGWGKYSGLMFKTKYTSPRLFVFKEDVNSSIHSWFVFFSFIVIWFDEEGEVIELRIVKPFKGKIKPSEKFRYILEIPLVNI